MPRAIAVVTALILGTLAVQAVDMPRHDPRRPRRATPSAIQPLIPFAPAGAPSAPASLPLDALSSSCATAIAGSPATIADAMAAQSAAVVALCPTDMQIDGDVFAAILANSRLAPVLAAAGYSLGSLRAATMIDGRLTLYVVIAG